MGKPLDFWGRGGWATEDFYLKKKKKNKDKDYKITRRSNAKPKLLRNYFDAQIKPL